MTARMMVRESGFTLVELLVAILIFLAMGSIVYATVRSGVEGSNTVRAVTDVSEEARLGLNRMIRDTREAAEIIEASADGDMYEIAVDFNRDGDTDDAGETERFEYDEDEDSIYLEGELLVEGVRPIGGADVFSFSSNFLQYDANGDGKSTWQEIDAVEDGNNDDLDEAELRYLSNVEYQLRVTSDDRSTNFYAEAQLRNRR